MPPQNRLNFGGPERNSPFLKLQIRDINHLDRFRSPLSPKNKQKRKLAWISANFANHHIHMESISKNEHVAHFVSFEFSIIFDIVLFYYNCTALKCAHVPPNWHFFNLFKLVLFVSHQISSCVCLMPMVYKFLLRARFGLCSVRIGFTGFCDSLILWLGA